MTEGKKTRRTAAEIAAHHREMAEKHEFRAKVAADPLLRDAVKLRDELSAADPHESTLKAALTAFIDARAK